MRTNIEELDVVAPLADIPGTEIKAGAIGAVIVKAEGAFLVEFVDEQGTTTAEVWLRLDEVRLVMSYAATPAQYASELIAA